MTTLVEGTHAGEFIVSEAAGSRSRDKITVKAGEKLVAGAVLEISAGEYVEFAGGTATGILFEAVDATAAAMSGVALVRDAEYNLSEVVYDAGQNQAAQDAAAVSLTALGLIAR